ncbi:unnamed protein product, partial [Meganyctiphanes norvegica]
TKSIVENRLKHFSTRVDICPKDDLDSGDLRANMEDLDSGDLRKNMEDLDSGDLRANMEDLDSSDLRKNMEDLDSGDLRTNMEDLDSGDLRKNMEDLDSGDLHKNMEDLDSGDLRTNMEDLDSGDLRTNMKDLDSGDLRTNMEDLDSGDLRTNMEDLDSGDLHTNTEDLDSGDLRTNMEDLDSGDLRTNMEDLDSGDHSTNMEDMEIGDLRTNMEDLDSGDLRSIMEDVESGVLRTNMEDVESGDLHMNMQDLDNRDLRMNMEDLDSGYLRTNMEDVESGDLRTNMEDVESGDLRTNMEDMESGDLCMNMEDMYSGDLRMNMEDVESGDLRTNMEDLDSGDLRTNMEDMDSGDLRTNMEDVESGDLRMNMEDLDSGDLIVNVEDMESGDISSKEGDMEETTALCPINYNNKKGLEVEDISPRCCKCCGCCECCCEAVYNVKLWCGGLLTKHERVLQILTKFITVVLDIIDVGSDIYTAYKYYTNRDIVWAVLTILFTLLPGMVVGIFGTLFILLQKDFVNTVRMIIHTDLPLQFNNPDPILADIVRFLRATRVYIQDSIWPVRVLLGLVLVIVGAVLVVAEAGVLLVSVPLMIFGALVHDLITSITGRALDQDSTPASVTIIAANMKLLAILCETVPQTALQPYIASQFLALGQDIEVYQYLTISASIITLAFAISTHIRSDSAAISSKIIFFFTGILTISSRIATCAVFSMVHKEWYLIPIAAELLTSVGVWCTIKCCRCPWLCPPIGRNKYLLMFGSFVLTTVYNGITTSGLIIATVNLGFAIGSLYLDVPTQFAIVAIILAVANWATNFIFVVCPCFKTPRDDMLILRRKPKGVTALRVAAVKWAVEITIPNVEYMGFSWHKKTDYGKTTLY